MPRVRTLAGGTRARHRVLAFGLLPVLVALVPLAHASPPDPTWLAGIYDDADFDEIVVAVVSASGAVNGSVLLSVKAADIPARTLRPGDTVLKAAVLASTFSTRSPPSAKPLPR